MKANKSIVMLLLLLANVFQLEAQIFEGIKGEKPVLMDCESSSKQSASDCTLERIRELVLAKAVYPSLARENGKEGTALMSLKINKAGEVVGYEILQDIGQDSKLALKRLYKRANLGALKFTPPQLANDNTLARYRFMLVFMLDRNGAIRSLRDIEEIFCERRNIFLIQSVKRKKLKQYVEKTMPIAEMWCYKHSLAAFKSFNIKLLRGGKVIKQWRNVNEIKGSAINKLLDYIQKEDVVKIIINEYSDGRIISFKKELLIR